MLNCLLVLTLIGTFVLCFLLISRFDRLLDRKRKSGMKR